MNFDGSDHQLVVALDKKNDQTVWRTDRSVDYKDLSSDGKPQAKGDFRKAFSTPHVAVLKGKPVLISQGAKGHYGYDPQPRNSGAWRNERIRPAAVRRRAWAVFTTGWSNGQLLAVRPGRNGSIDGMRRGPRSAAGGGPNLGLVWKAKRSVEEAVRLLVDDCFS